MMATMSHDITINLSIHYFIQEFIPKYHSFNMIRNHYNCHKHQIRHQTIMCKICMTTSDCSPPLTSTKKIHSRIGVEEDCCVNKGECFSAFFSCITTVSILKVASWMEWSYRLTFDTNPSWKASSLALICLVWSWRIFRTWVSCASYEEVATGM